LLYKVYNNTNRDLKEFPLIKKSLHIVGAVGGRTHLDWGHRTDRSRNIAVACITLESLAAPKVTALVDELSRHI
jgi:hypothetical protein